MLDLLQRKGVSRGLGAVILVLHVLHFADMGLDSTVYGYDDHNNVHSAPYYNSISSLVALDN